jgi:hypothetical protein
MQEVLALVTGIGSLLGIFGFLQWRVQKRILKLELMTKVHERYSAVYPHLAKLRKDISSYAELGEDEKAAISAYINLCSEQYHWRTSENLIDDAVWKVWEAAIIEKLSHRAIQLAWEDNHKNDLYYDGFCEFVEKHLRTPR